MTQHFKNVFSFHFPLFVATLLWSTLQAEAMQIVGAGSTFVGPVFSQWVTAYADQSGHKILYEAIGSGGGRRQLADKTVDFAVTDEPLSAQELAKNHYIQFPIVSSGIVIAYNLPIKKPLRITRQVLAGLFSGQITYWNDPQIAKINPHIHLPKIPVITVHRADGSGTTYNFSNYLYGATPYLALLEKSHNAKVTLAQKPTQMIQWPISGLGAKGNAGVANMIKHIQGAVGYLEYAYGKSTQLQVAQLENRAAKILTPSFAAFAASVDHSNWHSSKDFNQVINNPHGARSWPITATAFVLLPRDLSAKKFTQIRAFFCWVLTNPGAKKDAQTLSYVTMPKKLVATIGSLMTQKTKIVKTDL